MLLYITTSTGNAITWSCKCLEVYLLVGRKFKCNSDEAKAKHYRSFNCIIGKIGRSAYQEIIIELVRIKCLPIILYGIEACPLAIKASDQWYIFQLYIW